MCDQCAAQLHEDGYPLLSLGPWARHKLYYLEYYLSLFTVGMKNKWAQRAYIDIFAGPGLCLMRDSADGVIDGSPLIALKQKVPFTHHVFVDTDPRHTKALEARSKGLAVNSKKCFLQGDCNDSIVLHTILDCVPQVALSLLFIDPFIWNIHFNSLKLLTSARKTDLIVTFQVGGMKRAVQYEPKSLDSFFGDHGEWSDIYRTAGPNGGTRALLDYYKKRLSTLGYLEEHYPSEVPVFNTKHVPLYYLVFASKAPRGQQFWNEAVKKTAEGQRRLPGL